MATLVLATLLFMCWDTIFSQPQNCAVCEEDNCAYSCGDPLPPDHRVDAGDWECEYPECEWVFDFCYTKKPREFHSCRCKEHETIEPCPDFELCHLGGPAINRPFPMDDADKARTRCLSDQCKPCPVNAKRGFPKDPRIHRLCYLDCDFNCVYDYIDPAGQPQTGFCIWCDEPFVFIDDGEPKTWREANDICELAIIRTPDDCACARATIAAAGGSSAWIGLTSLYSGGDEGVFKYEGAECTEPIKDTRFGKLGQCVDCWEYKGRPRCPHVDSDEYGSQCVHLLPNGKMDNNVHCDDGSQISGVLCNSSEL